MHHAFINIQSYNVKQNLANFLWNLADISKLRGSSGQDYLICNSNLKTREGLQFTVTAKKCFAFHSVKKAYIIRESAFNEFEMT